MQLTFHHFSVINLTQLLASTTYSLFFYLYSQSAKLHTRSTHISATCCVFRPIKGRTNVSMHDNIHQQLQLLNIRLKLKSHFAIFSCFRNICICIYSMPNSATLKQYNYSYISVLCLLCKRYKLNGKVPFQTNKLYTISTLMLCYRVCHGHLNALFRFLNTLMD